MQVNHPPTLVTTDLSVPLFAANGTVVGDILAYDPDRNDTLSFSLLRGEQNGVADSVILSAFVVDALSGTLTLVNDHLFEVYRGNVSLLVLVMDDGFPSLNASGLITVHFTQPTVLPSYLFRISDLYIPENNAEHTCFDEAVVLLDASFSDVQYTVLSPLFTLESNGTFCVIPSLDYESQSRYDVSFYVSSPSIPIPTLLSLTVFVEDVNEEPVMRNERISVPEDALQSGWFYPLEVFDEDVGQTHAFSLAWCSAADCPFGVMMNGTLHAVSPLNYTHLNHYVLNVTVCDSGSPSLCSSASLFIRVAESLQNPVCYPEIYHVEEHSSRGSLLQPSYSAVSSKSVLYSLFGDSRFFIHPQSGSIRLLDDVDYETTPDHLIRLTVHAALASNSSFFCEAPLIVTVHDVNERPVILNAHDFAVLNVTEDLPLGAVFGDAIAVSDPDLNDSHFFSLQCLDSTLPCPFNITSEGRIVLSRKESFAHHIKSQWVVRIRVTDDGGLYDELLSTILLIDQNHAPFFSDAVLYRVGHYPLRLFDPVGLPVTATDYDMDELAYSITNSTAFEIDAMGQIRVLDASLNPYQSYTLIVEATDPLGLIASVVVVVSFDTYESSLSIEDASYSILENSPVGTVLLPPLSISGVFTAPLRFEIVYDGSLCPFAIGNATGLISLQHAVDYEERNSYSFTVLATDVFGQQGSANVTVHVVDVNEPPVMDSGLCAAARSVDEGAAENTFIHPPLHAVDPDALDSIQYSLQPLVLDEVIPFGIVPSSGLLYVSNSSMIDYDSHRSFAFRVVASDAQELSDSCLVRVDVNRMNRPPRIQWIEHTVSLSELTPVGSLVTIRSVVEDEDMSSLHFSITDATVEKNSSYVFPFVSAVNSSSVILSSALNASLQSAFVIRVCVYDSAGLSDCATVAVSILPSNRPPVFEEEAMTVTVKEDVSVGSTVITVHAEDEGSVVFYTITGSADFAVDGKTGRVFTIAPLDYERVRNYTLVIGAVDGVGASSEMTLTVLVEDMNEAPVCVASEHSRPIRVDERTPVGAFVTRVQVLDPEVELGEQSLTFAFSRPVEDFAISPNGTITVARPLDFWRHSRYLLMVSVHDSGSPVLSTVCSVALRIIDHNDPPVLHLEPSVVHVPESVVPFVPIPLNISVSDRDVRQQHVFFVNNTSVFSINPYTGELFVTEALDYEECSLFYVMIGVMDKCDAPLFDYATLTVIVDDVNEPPVFLQNEFGLQEDTPVNSTIGSVHYADEDYGVNGTVQCVQSSHLATFAIDEATCRITLIAPLDYERVDEYVVQVTLRDGGGLETVGTIHVAVLDVNEPPVISSLPQYLLLSPDTPAGALIGSPFEVTDPEHDDVTVSLSASVPVHPFSVMMLSPGRFSLFLNGTLQDLTFPIAVDVIACDASLCVNATTSIDSVVPVDLAPQIDPLVCSMVEHFPVHSALENCTLQLRNPELFTSVLFSKQFSLASDEFLFAQTSTHTAEVKVVEDVDYETTGRFVIPFSVEATAIADASVHTVMSVLTVEVLDVNEAPVFDAEPSALYVKENAVRNELLTPCVHAVDPDAGDASQPLQYSVTANEWFDIQSTTGCLVVKKSGLDFENAAQPKSWNLRVTVTDVHGASSSRWLAVLLQNVNEPPSFSQPAYYFSISTPVPLNTAVGHELPATDPDADSHLTFSIEQQSCNDAFTIFPTRALLRTTGEMRPEFEPLTDGHNRTCVVQVQVADEQGLTDSALVYVTIVSNVSPPAILTTAASVAENPAVNQTIVQLQAESRCGNADDSFRFVLLPSYYAASLAITETNWLVVKDPALFDFEQLPQFEVSVMAVDLGCYNVSATQTLTVTITDVNEPPVVGDLVLHVYPGATYPLVLSPPIAAEDPEGSRVTFSFLSPHANVTVHNSGVVMLTGDLAASIPAPVTDEPTVTTHRFAFSMLVTDSGTPPLSTPFTLIIDVDKMHFGSHSHPSFTPTFVEGSSATRFVREDTPVGAAIGPELHVDTEAETHPTLFFTIASCTPDCPVVVNSVTGALLLVKALDFEAVPAYSLNVTVTNGLASDWTLVRLAVLDVNDCAIHAISPQRVDPAGGRVVFEGVNLSPVGVGNATGLSGVLATGESFTTSLTVSFAVFDQLAAVVEEGELTDCFILAYGTAVACEMPLSMGASVLFQVTWQSSLANATQHTCSFTHTNALEYQHIVLDAVHGASSLPTAGGSVCFEGRHMGSRALYNAVPNRNAIGASATLVDASTQMLSACAYDRQDRICCRVGSGFGSTVTWEVCLYGMCSQLTAGAFAAPSIASITASGADSLNCQGGDNIVLRGANFGASVEALHVFMEDSEGQKELRNCQITVPHAAVRCESVEGVGDHLLFLVRVGDQNSQPFVSSLGYSAPVIADVYGAGAANALTAGGQVVYVAGHNLGANDLGTVLHYGNASSLVYHTAPCHLVLPHALFRCITVEGSGLANAWAISVASQRSAPFLQTQPIYGSPLVSAVSPLNTPLPTEGGLLVTIDGSNFGNDDALLHVQYANEKGIVYSPACSLQTNHTRLLCQTVPGFGSAVQWSIEVNGQRSDDLFAMAYAGPVVEAILCQTTCGSTTGGDRVLLRGRNFALGSQVLATYGFSSTEFEAKNCRVVSSTAIECTTAPGVGQSLQWTVYVGAQRAQLSSTLVYSYNTTAIRTTQAPVALRGGEEVFVAVSNDFTQCTRCAFQMVFNDIAVEAGVVNATTLSAYAPALSASALQVRVVVRYKQFTVETTNAVTVPLQSPQIASFMLASIPQEGSPSYLLSLFGSNFGFVPRIVSIRLLVRLQNRTQLVSCAVQKVSDDYASCATSFDEGDVTLIRADASSNTLHFSLHATRFDLSTFETNIEGYLVYPHLFNTRGGEELCIDGTAIPDAISVTIGGAPCPVSSVNATSLSCIVPPGEGVLLPVRLQLHQQVLLQIFASYAPPSILALQPSSLQYSTDALTLTGANFGFHPAVVLSGVASGAMDCVVTSHSHTTLRCTLAAVDYVGMVLQVVTAGQASNTVVLTVAPPAITTATILSLDGEALPGVPTAGEALVHLTGENLDADNTRCLLNGAPLAVWRKNATDVICTLEESFADVAVFSVSAGIHTSNAISVPFLPPLILSVTPAEGSTAGGDEVAIVGSNFGCSSTARSSTFLRFGAAHIPAAQFLECSHALIRFLTPEGQGRLLPLAVDRFNQSSAEATFSYAPPVIHSIEAVEVAAHNTHNTFNTSNITSTVSIEQRVLHLHGDNFGTHDAVVLVSGEECVLLQHNHTFIACLAPLFIGGNHTVSLAVSAQRSNDAFVLFPSPAVLRVDPLLVESTGGVIRLSGTHIPPVSTASIRLALASISLPNCHFAASPRLAAPFIECHLPELPRGTWPLTLAIGGVPVPIAPSFDHLTVVCSLGSYALPGESCQPCPMGSVCPANATHPIAGPGEWTDADAKSTVSPCFNPAACLGGNQCAAGYRAYKCSQCSAGFSRYDTWTCQRCPAGWKKVLPALRWILVCVALYLASAARLSTRFVWFVVGVDVLQLFGLLSLFRSRFSPLLAPVLDFSSLFVLDADLLRLECLLPGVKDTTVWLASLLILLVCVVIDLCVQLVCRVAKRRRSGLVRCLSLLYVLALPVLFQTLQSLSCHNKHFMAQTATPFTSLTVCWSNAAYRWVLLVSSSLLLLSLVALLLSIHFANQDRVFASLHGSPAATQLVQRHYSQNTSLLARVFAQESLRPLFAAFAVKAVFALLLVLLRKETHLQALLLLLLLTLLFLFLLAHPPFSTTRQYVQASLARSNLAATQTPASGEDAFMLHVTAKKRVWFDPNCLLLFGLVLFTLSFFDIALSSSASSFRVVAGCVVDALFAFFVVLTLLSGIGEWASLHRKQPNPFFEVIVPAGAPKEPETVSVHRSEDKAELLALKSSSLERLQVCARHNIVVPAISHAISTDGIGKGADELLQLSMSELLRNAAVRKAVEQDEREEGQSRDVHHDRVQNGGMTQRGEEEDSMPDDAANSQRELQNAIRLFEKAMDGK